MEGVKGWLLGVSFAALTGGIAYAFSPKGATDRIIRVAVSLFILVAAVSPFIGEGNSLSGGFSDGFALISDELNDALYEQISDNVAAAAVVKAKEVLSQYGLTDCGIEVDVKQKDGVVYAERITVYSKNGYGGCDKAIKSEIAGTTGAEVVTLE